MIRFASVCGYLVLSGFALVLKALFTLFILFTVLLVLMKSSETKPANFCFLGSTANKSGWSNEGSDHSALSEGPSLLVKRVRASCLVVKSSGFI